MSFLQDWFKYTQTNNGLNNQYDNPLNPLKTNNTYIPFKSAANSAYFFNQFSDKDLLKLLRKTGIK